MEKLNRQKYTQNGFTIVELVMVIVIMGVIGAMVAVFMKNPVDAYIDSTRRAALTDAADTTARRIARDVRKSLPNSVRSPSSLCLEFIPTKTGARYRSDETASGLSFTASDASFNMLGSNASLPFDQQMTRGDWIVVYNLGIQGANAYDSNVAGIPNNRTQIAAAATLPFSEAAGETTIQIDSKLFPLASSNKRFHVVPSGENVVSYVCNLSTGNLHRTVSTFTSAQTSSCPASGPILARKVTACSFNYSGSDLQRNALINMTIEMTHGSEVVSLQHEVHVNNTP